MKNNKVVIVSFHDWKSKRRAGFHHIGKAFLERGYKVYFVSHSRPLYAALFKKNSVHNFKNWWALMRGKVFNDKKGYLLNITGLNLSLPGPLRRMVGGELLNYIMQHISDCFLARKCFRICDDPQYVVIESGSSVFAYRWLKHVYTKAIFIYRPSDPCIGGSINKFLYYREKELVESADFIFLVNEEAERLYQKEGFDLSSAKTYILSNGIDVAAFDNPSDCPPILLKKPCITYVGGHPPDFNLIIKLARYFDNVNFIIICPEKLSSKDAAAVKTMENLYYIEGVFPETVPSYLNHSNVIIIPYKKAWAKKPLGMHGKILQAMACKKPIVCKNVDISLRDNGIYVAEDDEAFIGYVSQVIESEIKEVNYNYDFFDWKDFRKQFLKQLSIE